MSGPEALLLAAACCFALAVAGVFGFVLLVLLKVDDK